MTETRSSDAWGGGDAYERYMGRWSRPVAAAFLAWLALPTGLDWLDVGCGTGALSETILSECAPASLTCVEPAPGFRAAAQQRLGKRATVLAGDAEHLPLSAGDVDVVVSGLALNFVADPVAGLAEMSRVTRPGGTVAAYVWDYAGRMDLIRIFWDVAVSLDPAAGVHDEGLRFPLCRPDALEAAFRDAGLARVVVEPLDQPARFADFADFWQPFLGGTGPAPAYVAGLAAPERDALRSALSARLPVQPDGTIPLLVRAWAVRAATPG